ncbi:MAG: hypothetical protein ABR548_03930 [Actinomycetota bacterium]|nr:hypothetical protein [Actinomycetota bacterium]
MCESLLKQLFESDDLPVTDLDAVLVVRGSEDFALELKTRFPAINLLGHDGVLTDESPPAYPFSILISADGAVRLKTIGDDGPSIKALLQRDQDNVKEVVAR